jgi:uncharacterized protein (TIGR03083 family)
MEWSRLRDEITLFAREVGDLLRAAPVAATSLPGMTWSVGKLGAHLVSVPRRYRRMTEKEVPFPERLSAMNEAEIDAVGVTNPQELADLLEAETAQLLDVLGNDGNRVVPFFGMKHTVAGVGGVMLGELLLHGLDLARALGKPWHLRRDQALAITRGLLPSLPYAALNREVAQHAAGTYHVRLRGGDDWTIRVNDGVAAIEPVRPEGADLHLSADPVAYLLVGYGRMPRWKALLSGRMIAWGRKPWLAVRLGQLFVET